VTFRPASRSEAKPLVGLYSESGCGKTWSSLLLARGFVGPDGKIGMIETEGGRGEAYVGRPPVGDYFVRSLRQTFAPQEYGAAISEAEAAKLDALIIDSASHEWEGAGGVLAMAAANQSAGRKGVLVWQQPKIDHSRHFMLRLMQTPIPLVIVCMRAKYPMEQRGSEWVRSTKLEPKQSEDILYEMFVHAWIDQQHRAHVTKITLPELADVFIDGEPITIETGRRLSAWARGQSAAPASGAPPHAEAPPRAGAATSSSHRGKDTAHDAATAAPAISPAPSPPAGVATSSPAPSTATGQSEGPGTQGAPADHPPAGAPTSPDLMTEARAAADRGEDVFNVFYKRLTPTQKQGLTVIGEDLRTRMNAAKEQAHG